MAGESTRGVPGERARLPYNPALDGVRAVAVLAVLAYHLEVPGVPGGFLGVDVFFALSGYLITTLLLLEHQSTGRIHLPSFWARRARRLLPALLVTLLLVAAYAAIAADPVQLATIRGDSIASLLYVANWRFVLTEQSYFEAFADPSPLRHAWSLAIEEQWYLLWPAAALWLARRGPDRRTPAWLLGAAAASAAVMAALGARAGVDFSRAYYGTDARVQTLLVGAVLAFVLHDRTTSARDQVLLERIGWVGAAVLVAAFVLVHDDDRFMYAGGFLVVAMASTALVAAAVQARGALARGLSVGPLVAVGTVSYGVYLYHWPVIVWMSEGRTGLDGPALGAARIAATAALAWLSHRFVERPVRQGRRLGIAGRVPNQAALAAVASVLVVGTVVLATQGAETLGEEREGAADVHRAGDVRVYVTGDSVMQGLAILADGDDLAGIDLSSGTVSGCGFLQARAAIPGAAGAVRKAAKRNICQRERQEQYDLDWVPFDPQVSVLQMGAYEIYDHFVDGQRAEVGSDAYAELFLRSIDEHIRLLSANGSPVVVLTVHCMRSLPPERSQPWRVEAINELIRQLPDRHPGVVTVLDLHGFTCPTGRYQEKLDGVDLFKDGLHFNESGAHVIWEWLVPQLLEVVDQHDAGAGRRGRD